MTVFGHIPGCAPTHKNDPFLALFGVPFLSPFFGHLAKTGPYAPLAWPGLLRRGSKMGPKMGQKGCSKSAKNGQNP